jgi:hypothetical protein
MMMTDGNENLIIPLEPRPRKTPGAVFEDNMEFLIARRASGVTVDPEQTKQVDAPAPRRGTSSISSPFTNSKAAQPLQNTLSSANYSSLSSSNWDDVDVYENDDGYYYSGCWDG